jgi:transposase-like protein
VHPQAVQNATLRQRFLRKRSNAAHTQVPRVINVDKKAAYPSAIEDLKADSGTARNYKIWSARKFTDALPNLNESSW